MPKIANPHDGLLSYQQALLRGEIDPVRCTLHPDLTLLMDQAGGENRLTFALVENGTLKATVVYLMADFYEGLPCFQVGYAVAEPFRRQGIAAKVVEQTIEEMQHGFRAHMPRFYIEAVVARSNVASNKVASKVISAQPEAIEDEASGEPAFQYFRLIGD
jgi:RimJ/RimL family protein N-acetyltransferase